MQKNIYNELKTSLGESDAQCECIEVFLRIAEEQYNESDSFNLLAKEYGVTVNNISTSEACNLARKGFILSVHRLFEVFLIKLMEIMKTMGFYGSFEPKDKESKLKCIYKRVFDMSRHNDENYTLFLLCEYYRLIRNTQAHNSDDKEKLEKTYIELKNQIKRGPSSVNLKLDAPNSLEKLGFDDFILFSRAVKKLSRNLFCEIDFDENKVAELYSIEKLKKVKTNKERVCQIIRSDLRMQYYLSEKKEKQIVDIVVNKLYNN